MWLAVALPAGMTWAQGNAGGAAAPLIRAQETRGTAEERAEALLKQLTLEEKMSLLSGTQFSTRAIPRLGIPSFDMSDGPAGVRNGPGNPSPPACAFPCGSALAATWDGDLAAAYGKAIGLEARARGTHYQLGPGLNIVRIPICGRNFEYFGEDPFLAGVITARWAKGCSEQGVVPTLKHFAANNQEVSRNSVDAQIDERTLREIYLPAFERGIREGGVTAVMCSYNRLNGIYASNHDWLLNQVLKREWGFKGIVMSDWGASHNVTDVAKGLDLEMPSGANLNARNLQAALTDGRVKEADIDGAVRRFLWTAAAMGWLDEGWQRRDTSLAMDSEESAKVAREVARASIVLLKNERQALPLDRSKVKTIVVVGPNATAAQEGQLPANIGGGGSGAVTPYPGRYANADYLKGITRLAGEGVKVTYLPMPAAPTGWETFEVFAHARTSADGPAGLTLSVEVTGAGEAVSIAPSVQRGVNVEWQAGQLPFGVPAGRDATFTWRGVVQPPQDVDLELRTVGAMEVSLDGRAVPAGSIVPLQGGRAVALQVVARAQANPPVGRGARGARGARGGAGGGLMARAALAPPAIPDMTAARTADAVIVCIGLNRNSESEGRDRPFDLPGIQQYLVKAAGAANPRTIVITNGGAAVGMESWMDRAAALLHAWYLGQEGGLAIGDVLFGDVNPSGRLCSTFDRRWEENPAYASYPGTPQPGVNYPAAAYTEGVFYGYRGYDKAGKEPLFPFGFGLSYTTFELSRMTAVKNGGQVRVSLDVRNTGGRAGAQVVQVYVGEQGSPVPRPLRELKGIAKVSLEPGQSKRVEVALPRESFMYWSPEKKGWTLDEGHRFVIEAGVSQRDIRARQEVVIP